MVRLPSKREMLAQTLFRSGLGPLFRRVAPFRGLLVLNYHRIGNASQTPFDGGLFSATAEQFEQQLAFYRRHFDVLSIDDLATAGRNPAGRYLLITFDDGYRDNYDLAFPLLRAARIPALFFLASGFLDAPRVPWWDEIAWMFGQTRVTRLDWREHFEQRLEWSAESTILPRIRVLRRYWSLPGSQTVEFLDTLGQRLETGRVPAELARTLFIDWEMARTMQAAGIQFGAHTVNHPILGRLTRAEQFFEVAHSKQRLDAELNQQTSAFSYPVGKQDMFNADTRDALREAGLTWGFSHYGGMSDWPICDPYDIRRVPVEVGMSPAMLQAVTTLPKLLA